MKLSKDNWVKIASPVVLIAFGVLLIFTPLIDSISSAMNTLIAVILIIAGAFYLSLGFLKRRNVLDLFALMGIGMISLGTTLLIKTGFIDSLVSYIGIAIGWAMFLFGCLAFILSIYHLAKRDSMHWLFTNFYIIELILAIVCGVVGGLIVFPTDGGIIISDYLWMVHGIMFVIFGTVWLIQAIDEYKAERRAARRSSVPATTSSSSSSSSSSSADKSTSSTTKKSSSSSTKKSTKSSSSK